MLSVQAGIIGGTGLGDYLLRLPGDVIHVPTSKGFQRGRVVGIAGRKVFLMSRHSAGHKVPPHKVNYAAMALALQEMGAKACLASAAVGSLHKEWPCGTLIACSDFLDVSGRFPTLFDQAVVHTDFSRPFAGRNAILSAAKELAIDVRDGGVYVCGNGPRYETPAEIELYSQMRGDVVGMTAASEAIVMREAGIDYGCLAIVTNLACGLTVAPLSHLEVTDQMKLSGETALRVLTTAISYI